MAAKVFGRKSLTDRNSTFESDAALFAAIVANSTDAIISKSLIGVVETWNPAAEKLFGWTSGEIIGASISRIIPESRVHEETAILERIRAGETVPRFRTERVSKSGELIPISVTVSPVRAADGTVTGASKIANDLREQNRLVSDLRQQTDQFTALANNIPQMTWLADESGYIYWYNQRWYDYTGTTLEHMQGWGWRDVHHPDHVDRVVERIQRSWDTGEVWEDTFPLRRKDGVFRWFLSRAAPLKDESGEIVLWCGSNTDITEELESREHIALLMREVNHRSRNMLAVMQAMIKRARYSEVDDLSNALLDRIAALKSNQEILDGGDWTGALIANVVRSQLEHLGPLQERISIQGDERLVIDTRCAEALGLAIHELATNAEKYGALSGRDGEVAIVWQQRDNDEGSSRLYCSWMESGGPPVSRPAKSGFGTVLIERNIETVFGADVALDYAEAGFRWAFSAPAENCLIDKIERMHIHSYL